ncbi:hypothetical protein O3G_MSEX012418 [Manduca sexta]|uniref:Ionotropic glutamate receptor L-glutamate and glycine-binding domain-containing protein n=1 Tax=Manduca sexta TaxID=7130 RepID=A0A921ZQR7_MANSE|nr:hypothetical protein O3G_MSEX012418 [Manduca sexta]
MYAREYLDFKTNAKVQEVRMRSEGDFLLTHDIHPTCGKSKHCKINNAAYSYININDALTHNENPADVFYAPTVQATAADCSPARRSPWGISKNYISPHPYFRSSIEASQEHKASDNHSGAEEFEMKQPLLITYCLILLLNINVVQLTTMFLTSILMFRIYYNQATPDRLNHLTLVNWWAGRLYKSPVLPPADKVYQDFKGRIFDVPVLHAPPWHFVRYNNDSSVRVTGGRDDKLLALIAKKLNFRYRYYDPPDRSQGSRISGNGTFKGTLGLIWKRQADFFLGDVTMTWERLQAVEFSFLTLADSGAFLTHAPAKLSETLAIIRPFRWEVWPLVCATLLVTGPALWVVIAAPSLWQRRQRDQLGLLNNCCWFTTTFKEPSKTHKARLVSVLISLGATYVIGDMYSANLTSLLARPAREQPIGTLSALEEAMRDHGYELVVETHSSSLAILENGTGVYGRLAKLMRRQRVQRVRNVEMGVRLVLTHKRVAVLGGRETLYYDTERFGSHNFHLSEKLYTRYSAIAFQIGCPYLETFNNVVMTLFEAGILSKMTTDEYKNLPEQARKVGACDGERSRE